MSGDQQSSQQSSEQQCSEQLDDLRALSTLIGQGLYQHLDVRVRCGSTNAELIAAAADLPAGSVLVTDHQTSGRGRFARPWQTPPGATVALSVLLRPQAPPAHWSWLPHLAGIAVVEGIGRVSGLDAVLKWPNDVLIDGAKVCGILVEGVLGGRSDQQAPAVVLGIGLNIAFEQDNLPVPTATSLALKGYRGSRTEIVRAVLEAFQARYWQWESGDLAGVRADYAKLCATIGAPVRLELPQRSLLGTVEGVDESGRLLLRTDQGVSVHAAGDVVHLRRQ